MRIAGWSTMIRSFRHCLERGTPWILVGWMLGVFCKDRWFFSKFLYFVPPLAPLLLGLLWLSASSNRKTKPVSFVVAGIAGLSLLKILAVDSAWNADLPTGVDPIRLVHWNVSWGLFGGDPISKRIAQDQPDLCVFSEAPKAEVFEEMARQLQPNGQTLHALDLALISRFPFEEGEGIPLRNGRGWWVRIHAPQGDFLLAAVDVQSNAFKDRNKPLMDLDSWLSALPADLPLILVGDFNTPRDSVYFTPLRKKLRNAFEIAGWGWPYTWPMPLPMYALDHTWVSPGIQDCSYQLRPALCSDHLRQVVEFSLVSR
jgi:hypothetical protein